MPEDAKGRLMTAKEVARRLGLSLGTVYTMAREGKIPTIRVGRGRTLRFDLDEVKRALAGAPPPGAAGPTEPDPLLAIHELAAETGIKDLAEHHDHYLYGVR